MDREALLSQVKAKYAERNQLHGPVNTELGQLYWKEPDGIAQDKILKAAQEQGPTQAAALAIVIRARDENGRRLFRDADAKTFAAAGFEFCIELAQLLGINDEPAAVDDVKNSSSGSGAAPTGGDSE